MFAYYIDISIDGWYMLQALYKTKLYKILNLFTRCQTL